MADRPQSNDTDTTPSSTIPAWARSMRVSKEQLAAAERTREYHVRKLQGQLASIERKPETKVRGEH